VMPSGAEDLRSQEPERQTSVGASEM
jgi:hypothetical protein